MPPSFIPAMHFHALTPLYEAAVRPFMGKMWREIAEEAAKRTPQEGTVLDIGCGPGTILRRIGNIQSDLRLIGTDVDQRMIQIAQRKARGVPMAFECASAGKQPCADHSIDVVLSSLMAHHLPEGTKRAMFREVKRILKPHGTFLLCDFSVPSKERTWLPLTWWKFMEPEIKPQLAGQLLSFGREIGANIETIRTAYGCIALHVLTFT